MINSSGFRLRAPYSSLYPHLWAGDITKILVAQAILLVNFNIICEQCNVWRFDGCLNVELYYMYPPGVLYPVTISNAKF